MNNQVLRRKLFNAVLKDRSQPSGILASSSELAETVQRRNNGGANFMGGKGSQTVGNAFAKMRGIPLQADGSGMPEGEESYLQLLRRIKDLPYEQQKEILRRQGFGAQIGSDIDMSTRPLPEGEGKEGIAAMGDAITGFFGGTGEVARPIETEDGGILGLIKKGIGKMGEDLREITDPIDRKLGYLTYDETEDKGMPTGEPTLPGTPLPASDLITPEDDEFGNLPAPAVPKTVAEEVSETAVTQSKATETQEKASEEADVETTQKQAQKSKRPKPPSRSTPFLDKATELIKQRKENEAKSKNTIANTKDPETAANAVATIRNIQEDPQTSNKKKAEATDELLGIVPAGEKPTLKERMEARKALIKDLLGEDKAKDIRTDANYNLMMTGLMIAAGESPNALSNIAKGAAAGLQQYGDLVGGKAEEENKREREIALQAVQEVRGEIAEEKRQDYDSMVREADRKHQLNLQEIKDINALKRLDRQLTADEQRQIKEFEFKQDLADQTFDQNLMTLGIKGEQQLQLQDANNEFKSQLAEFQQNAPSDDMKMVEAIASAGNLSFEDAYAVFKSKSFGRPTDEQARFAQLIAAGVPGSHAYLMSQAGFGKALVEDLGVAGAEQYVEEKMGGAPQDQSQVPVSDIPKVTTKEEYDNLPSGTEFIQNGQRRRKP